MFDYTALKKSHHSADWFGESGNGVGLYVRGGDDSPDENAVAQAKAVVAALNEIQAKAVAVADSFMKDRGDWSLSEIDVGLEAQRASATTSSAWRLTPRTAPAPMDIRSFPCTFELTETSLPRIRTIRSGLPSSFSNMPAVGQN